MSCWRSTHETSERKVVTVLFADLVSFTARSEQLDPGDVDAMLGPYHERLRYEPERWGGRWRSSSARHLSMIRTSVWG
jgi:class 3 adenylate cyclase